MKERRASASICMNGTFPKKTTTNDDNDNKEGDKTRPAGTDSDDPCGQTEESLSREILENLRDAEGRRPSSAGYGSHI